MPEAVQEPELLQGSAAQPHRVELDVTSRALQQKIVCLQQADEALDAPAALLTELCAGMLAAAAGSAKGEMQTAAAQQEGEQVSREQQAEGNQEALLHKPVLISSGTAVVLPPSAPQPAAEDPQSAAEDPEAAGDGSQAALLEQQQQRKQAGKRKRKQEKQRPVTWYAHAVLVAATTSNSSLRAAAGPGEAQQLPVMLNEVTAGEDDDTQQPADQMFDQPPVPAAGLHPPPQKQAAAGPKSMTLDVLINGVQAASISKSVERGLKKGILRYKRTFTVASHDASQGEGWALQALVVHLFCDHLWVPKPVEEVSSTAAKAPSKSAGKKRGADQQQGVNGSFTGGTAAAAAQGGTGGGEQSQVQTQQPGQTAQAPPAQAPPPPPPVFEVTARLLVKQETQLVHEAVGAALAAFKAAGAGSFGRSKLEARMDACLPLISEALLNIIRNAHNPSLLPFSCTVLGCQEDQLDTVLHDALLSAVVNSTTQQRQQTGAQAETGDGDAAAAAAAGDFEGEPPAGYGEDEEGGVANLAHHVYQDPYNHQPVYEGPYNHHHVYQDPCINHHQEHDLGDQDAARLPGMMHWGGEGAGGSGIPAPSHQQDTPHDEGVAAGEEQGASRGRSNVQCWGDSEHPGVHRQGGGALTAHGDRGKSSARMGGGQHQHDGVQQQGMEAATTGEDHGRRIQSSGSDGTAAAGTADSQYVQAPAAAASGGRQQAVAAPQRPRDLVSLAHQLYGIQPLQQPKRNISAPRATQQDDDWLF